MTLSATSIQELVSHISHRKGIGPLLEKLQGHAWNYPLSCHCFCKETLSWVHCQNYKMGLSQEVDQSWIKVNNTFQRLFTDTADAEYMTLFFVFVRRNWNTTSTFCLLCTTPRKKMEHSLCKGKRHIKQIKDVSIHSLSMTCTIQGLLCVVENEHVCTYATNNDQHEMLPVEGKSQQCQLYPQRRLSIHSSHITMSTFTKSSYFHTSNLLGLNHI